MFDWGVLKQGVIESEWFCISNHLIYTFVMLTQLMDKSFGCVDINIEL